MRAIHDALVYIAAADGDADIAGGQGCQHQRKCRACTGLTGHQAGRVADQNIGLIVIVIGDGHIGHGSTRIVCICAHCRGSDNGVGHVTVSYHIIDASDCGGLKYVPVGNSKRKRCRSHGTFTDFARGEPDHDICSGLAVQTHGKRSGTTRFAGDQSRCGCDCDGRHIIVKIGYIHRRHTQHAVFNIRAIDRGADAVCNIPIHDLVVNTGYGDAARTIPIGCGKRDGGRSDRPFGSFVT